MQLKWNKLFHSVTSCSAGFCIYVMHLLHQLNLFSSHIQSQLGFRHCTRCNYVPPLFYFSRCIQLVHRVDRKLCHVLSHGLNLESSLIMASSCLSITFLTAQLLTALTARSHSTPHDMSLKNYYLIRLNSILQNNPAGHVHFQTKVIPCNRLCSVTSDKSVPEHCATLSFSGVSVLHSHSPGPYR